jgi:hypothetical protein
MVSQDSFDWTRLHPIVMWRDWIVRTEEQWSSALSSLMKDERAGEVLHRQADEVRMMHRMFSEMAQASLAAANLPSRTDLEALDERLGRVEDGLAAVSAEISKLREALVANGAARELRPRPRRNRRA